MYRQLLVVLFAVCGAVIALSDVDQRCIASNSEAWSNDNLIGTWFMIMQFMQMGGSVPFDHCHNRTFTKPTEDIIEQYKNKYNEPNLPYNIDDNPVLITDGGRVVDGLVSGHNVAKFYVLTPNSTMSLGWDHNYEVNAYKQLTPKYIMFTECKLRGSTRWLMTTDRHAPVPEMEELIRNTPELRAMNRRQRYCAAH